MQSCYQALNIASLYIPFLPAKFKEKKKCLLWTSGVYFILLFIQKPGTLSFPLLLPLTPSPWVIATTHIYQLQIKGVFATGIGNRWQNQAEALGWKVQLFWWLVSGNVSQWHSFSQSVSSALWRLTYCKLKCHPRPLSTSLISAKPQWPLWSFLMNLPEFVNI